MEGGEWEGDGRGVEGSRRDVEVEENNFVARKSFSSRMPGGKCKKEDEDKNKGINRSHLGHTSS